MKDKTKDIINSIFTKTMFSISLLTLIFLFCLNLCPMVLVDAFHLVGSGISGSTCVDSQTGGFIETFEGDGYSGTGWSESVPTGATVDENYTTDPLMGSESLQIVGGSATNAYIGKAITETSELWYHGRVSVADSTPSGESNLFFIRNSSSATISLLTIRTDGSIRLYHGTANATTAASFISDNTAYHVLIRYLAGDGSDGVSTAWIWLVGETMPETPTLSINNGNASTGAVLLRLYAGVGMTNVFDQVIVSTEEPTICD